MRPAFNARRFARLPEFESLSKGTQMFGRIFSALLVVLTASAAPGPSSAQTVSPAEAQAIAKDAYVYSYAMMESYQTWRTQAVDKTANGYVGGFNVFRHYSQPFTLTTRTLSRRTTTRPTPGHGSISAPNRWWSAFPQSPRTAIT
jgi:hypothetical protein